jgi:hypothetical protein
VERRTVGSRRRPILGVARVRGEVARIPRAEDQVRQSILVASVSRSDPEWYPRWPDGGGHHGPSTTTGPTSAAPRVSTPYGSLSSGTLPSGGPECRTTRECARRRPPSCAGTAPWSSRRPMGPVLSSCWWAVTSTSCSSISVFPVWTAPPFWRLSTIFHGGRAFRLQDLRRGRDPSPLRFSGIRVPA